MNSNLLLKIYMKAKQKPKDLLPKPVRPTRKNYNIHLYG